MTEPLTPTAPDQDEYVRRVTEAIKVGDPSVTPYLTRICPECDEEPARSRWPHTVDVNGFVLVGCEGYWVVDPNVLGLDRPNWSGDDPYDERDAR
jgi:hypothetical protein